MSRLLIFAVSVVLGLLPAQPSRAQWMPNGVRVNGTDVDDIPRVVADGSGGAYVVWRRYTPSSDDDVFLQHITAAGTIASGWPPTGLPVAVQPFSQGLLQLIADGVGGAIVIWYDFERDPETGIDLVVQRIKPDGSVASGWSPAGLRIRAPGGQQFALSASDGAGGVYVLWEDSRAIEMFQNADVYATHILQDGSFAPGWPADGIPITVGPAAIGLSAVIPDDEGGVFFLWGDTRNGFSAGETFGVRLQADGSIASGWTVGGALLSPGQYARGACGDGAGGFYLWTADHAPPFEDRVYRLRRFTADSSPAPGWPAEGILVCDAPGRRAGAPAIADGQGGIIAVWTDYRRGRPDLFALRVRPDATIAPGWTANGSMISDPLSPYSETNGSLAPDMTGGAYVVWRRNSSYVAVNHLTANGQTAPGWPDYGVFVAGTNSQYDRWITSDAEGGAIVVWLELTPADRRGIYAQRYVADGIVATELALVSAAAEPDRVRLEWFGADAPGLGAIVERRSEGTPWVAIAAITADGTGHLRYEDHDVRPGQRYGYRLTYVDGPDGARTTRETWVTIPAVLDLALEGFRPNPAVGAPTVAFALPRSGAGRLELYDLAGRRVAERDLASLPAGRHVIALEATSPLQPGAYLLRLTHGGVVLSARGVIVR